MSFKENPPQKILIINIFGIGDVLFTTPLISNLKAQYPNIKIGYLCNRRTESVLRSYSKVDQVFVYERDEFNQLYRKSKIGFVKAMLEFWRTIKRERYDVVIDVSLSSFTSFFTWAIGIKERIGFNYKNRSRWLSKKINLEGYEGRHVVDYYLSLLDDLGVASKVRDLEIPISIQDEEWVGSFLKNNKIADKKYLIGLVPGGGASWGKDAIYKRWAPANYAKLADKMIEKYAAVIILVGDQKEEALCREVSRLMQHPSLVVCGQTTISQFGALAKKSSLMVLNDGGPLHMAVAAGAKTISIFGPVDEKVYGPYSSQGRHVVVTKNLPCRPCYRQFRRASCTHISCLQQITVEDVLSLVSLDL